MDWVINLVEGADIEEVTDDMLEKMILKQAKLSVLFYEENEAESSLVLTALEEIDDDLDEMGVLFVKINEATVASEFGIEDRPTLVIFEKGIPNLFLGNLQNPDEVLEWIIGEISGDHTVEVVTDAMLDRLINTHPHVAAFFYDKDKQTSLKALEVLETIDDDVYDHSQIKMVKIDDPEEALEYGLKTLPALVFFEHKMPNIYEGNLLEAHKVSSWITDIAMEDKIEFVTPAMLDKLLDDYMNIAVFIHDRFVTHDKSALKDLETIDDDLDREGVHLLRLQDENGELADKYELDVVPCLVLFHEKSPYIFKGEVGDENEAIKWFRATLASFDE